MDDDLGVMRYIDVYDSINVPGIPKNGKPDKVDEYLRIYESHFNSIREKPLNILEIGVQYGGGLRLLRKYFSHPQTRVTGIDASYSCNQYILPTDDVKLYIGNQHDTRFMETVNEKSGPFDIIIDDGGHTMHQQKTSFNCLFLSMNPNGVYVIEDLHTSYWPQFGTEHEETTMSYFQKIAEYPTSCNAARSSRCGSSRISTKPTRLESNIRSLHFYDSILFIYRKGINY